MSLIAGTRLGPYEILAAIGAGGMGEVYKARDVRLDRTVAIKVLPHDKVADPDRERRFLQEARAASALNHPHIVTLHDIVHEAGIDVLVMEYVPGKSLDQLIPAKGLPLAEAIEYAQQIAGALAAAHAAGVVHRDIKPANVIVTPEGRVKVLDFGLAKLVERDINDPAGETRTRAASLTEPGLVIGTVAYMSPEQAAGRELDHRTDIFSLGVVLYEMLAGHRPFRGKSQVETMNATINSPAAPLSQPRELQDVLDKALAKDPQDRYQHAGDLRLDLRRFLQRPPAAQTARPGTTRGLRLAWTAAALLLLAAPGAWWIGRRTVPVTAVTSPEDISLTAFTTNLGYNDDATISPDGQTIAYVSDRSGHLDLFLRQIGQVTDIQLTRDQGDNILPAFSPDGRQLAFVSSRAGGPVIFHGCCDNHLAGGGIWVMPAYGGPARRLVEEGQMPSWTPDGSSIVFVRQRRAVLFQVASTGGEVREIPLQFKGSTPLGIQSASYSSDGRWIFFETTSGQTAIIFAVPATGGAVLQVTKGGQPAWDAPAQSIVYVNSDEGRNYSLWTIPFSTADGKVGTPRPLTIGRGRDWKPTVSRDGRLIAYTAISSTFNMEVLPIDAEEGKVLGAPRPITSGNQIIYFMRFSPDGRSVVFQSARGAGNHIWRVDIGGDAVQLTSDPKYEEFNPFWSPDGKTLSFVRSALSAPAARDLWLMAADGANPRRIEIRDTIGAAGTPRWLPDNSGVLYVGADTRLHVYDLASRQTRIVPGQSAAATMPTISADGQWIVYQSVAKGAGNVDVGAIPLTGGEARLVVSTAHQEYHPFLSPSGRWLYFQWDHKNLYRVPGPAQDWKPAEPAKITDFPESGLFLEDPQISRDGKQLLYSRAKITGDIWVLKRGK